MTSTLEVHTALLDKKFLERLEKCTNLPSPPAVAMRILDLSQDPDVDIGKVADAVSMDPALVTKLLRIANSPMYAIRRKTENLRQAIMLLGLNGTLTMTLSFSLTSSMHNNAGQGFDYNLYWQRSLAIATCCRRLSKVAGLKSPEEMFLIGLLQDIGMLALDKLQPDFYANLGVDQSDHVLLQEKERELLGADHAVIGAWLMHKWRLPEFFEYVLLGSHDLQLLDPENEYIAYARCVMTSGLLVDALSREDSELDLGPVLKLVSEKLGIEEAELAEILGPLNEDLAETASIFETDLTDYALSETLIDRAKESMMLLNLKTIRQSDRLQQEAEKLEDLTRTLEEKAIREGLTGLYNRTYFDDRLKREFAMAKERDWPLAVLFIDLDHFKHVNDTYGHQAGDQILQETAHILSKGTRDDDVVARYGGEEFVIILPGCDEKSVRIVADRLVKAFRNTPHQVNGGEEIVVTASIGCSLIVENSDYPDAAALVSAADIAVYKAKNQGRNCFVVYSDDLSKVVSRKEHKACSG